MSGSVDVLLVMSKCANQAELGAIKYGGSVLHDHAQSIKAARAAVERLIEACEFLQKYPDDFETQAEFCAALSSVRGDA